MYNAPPVAEPSNTTRAQRFENRRLIVFADAGVGTLDESHSAEGTVAVLAQVAARDGRIHYRGYMIDHRCAKIHRSRKSSLASESRADLAAAD